MYSFLRHVLSGQNQFASGGLLLMLFGSLGVSLHALPARLLSWLLQQATMLVKVKDDDAAFAWVKEWFLEQDFLSKVRQVDLDTTIRSEDLALMPAPGVHFFWYGGRPFWIYFQRSEDTKGRSQRRIETLTFRTIGRDQRFLKRFVGEVIACHKRQVMMDSSLYVYEEYWTRVQAYSPRLLDSVILMPGQKEDLVNDLRSFKSARARYRKLGVPYHRGYLLYGPPGTGKTSLVSGLAAEFGMSIYLINLADFNDRTLKAAMNEVPGNSVILFEDIDAARSGKRRPEANEWLDVTPEAPAAKGQDTLNSGVTLSGLLNVIDGFHAPENVVFVMTTNHAEALDPALLRPGRIDYRLHLGEAVESQRMELYLRFFPESTRSQARDFAQTHGSKTMAEFQGLLLSLGECGELEPALQSR